MKSQDEHPLWVDKVLKPAWIAVAAGMTCMLIVSLWTPDVEPIMPEQAALLDDAPALGEPDSAGSDDGFVTRPLFLTNRRPLASNAVVSEFTQPQDLSEDVAEQIEGVTLLGIFSSDTASGVILSEKGLGQRRISEGDYLQGWELVGVESRGAVFSGGGRIARLDMQIVSRVATPSVRRDNSDDQTTRDASSSEGDVSTAQEAPSFVPTFENIYQSRLASDLDESDAGDAERNSRKQGNTDNEK